jgi:hypothetical protein
LIKTVFPLAFQKETPMKRKRLPETKVDAAAAAQEDTESAPKEAEHLCKHCRGSLELDTSTQSLVCSACFRVYDFVDCCVHPSVLLSDSGGRQTVKQSYQRITHLFQVLRRVEMATPEELSRVSRHLVVEQGIKEAKAISPKAVQTALTSLGLDKYDARAVAACLSTGYVDRDSPVVRERLGCAFKQFEADFKHAGGSTIHCYRFLLLSLYARVGFCFPLAKSEIIDPAKISQEFVALVGQLVGGSR